MSPYLHRALIAVLLLISCIVNRAEAGSLAKSDVERMVDYFYTVGEIQADLPVYPLFVKDPASPEAKPELKAYVFESLDFAPVRGYSGKPINVLIIMDLSGNFLKLRLLEHREPLFLDAAGTQKLERFASQYKGLSARHNVEIGPFNDPGLRNEQTATVKGVQQGTISIKAINRAILTTAAAVATAKLKNGADENPAAYTLPKESKDAKEIKEAKETKDIKEAKEAKAQAVVEDVKPVTSITPPVSAVAEISKAERKPAAGAVASPAESAFSPSEKSGVNPSPVMPKEQSDRDPATNARNVEAEAPISPLALRSGPTDEPVPQPRSAVEDTSEMQGWIDAWRARWVHIAILLTGLAVLSIALFAQRRFSADSARFRQMRTLYLLFTLGFIGWTAQGQLTVVNITAAIESLATGGDLSFLMNDPITVILWVFVGITLLVWGRGTFCGWLCPFGALQELISLLAQAAGIRQRRLRAALDARLKWIKYLILATLLISLYVAPPVAELGSEVEPFKTAISLYFMRDWPYVLWAVSCLLLGIVVYRGYCRYICPLGAALASVNFLQRWSWIPRRDVCGTPCQTCRHRCEYQAISPAGKVDYSECFQCLDCVSIYQDSQRCFPLIQQRRAENSGTSIIVLKRV